MDIVKIAHKLEPLMPEKVSHWLMVRDFADPILKSLIETEIVSTAHRLLGDFRKKPLLSLPSESNAKGEFNLGTILYENEKWPVGLSSNELLQNLAILGRSGAGKTNVAFHLLEQLVKKGVPFLFLDWKRTGRHLIPFLDKPVNVFTPGRKLSPFKFSPFMAPPRMEYEVYIKHVVDMFAEAYTLGEGVKYLLQKSLHEFHKTKAKPPTIRELIESIESIPDKERVRGWKISTLRALESLALANLDSQDSMTQAESVRNLTEGNTIIELDALSQTDKKFLIPLLCFWLYSVKLSSSRREELSLVIFIEEAHHVLLRQEQRSKETLMNMLLRQCREVGISCVVIDQHCHLVSTAAIGNTFTTICLNQRDPSDINKAAGLSLLDMEEKRFLSTLPIGQGIVKLQDRWQLPFLVQFPEVEIEKGKVTDNVLLKYLEFLRTHSEGRRSASTDLAHFWGNLGTDSWSRDSLLDNSESLGRIPWGDDALSEDALAFLNDVICYRSDGVATRYKRLRWGMNKGSRLKEYLVRKGWLDAEQVAVGKSRKYVVRLSQRGREALGLNETGSGRESIAHEYWKRWYARKFRKQGYEVELEAFRAGGRVDVLALKDDERVGIEIETGKSDVVENVKNCLREKFDKIVLVATDKKALVKVERELAKEGLIIPNRIRLVLQDAHRIN